MRHQKTKPVDDVDKVPAGADTTSVGQSPGASQVRQSPLQHYIVTGQLTPVSVADVSATQQSLSPRARMLGKLFVFLLHGPTKVVVLSFRFGINISC